MCQCQLSSLTLPSEAAMPPCAATVCERVGNTLDSTATFSPACANCNAARIPEPPAPTTTTSNVLFATAILFSLMPDYPFGVGRALPDMSDGTRPTKSVIQKPHSTCTDQSEESNSANITSTWMTSRTLAGLT